MLTLTVQNVSKLFVEIKLTYILIFTFVCGTQKGFKFYESFLN